jgi:hypothetical protein
MNIIVFWDVAPYSIVGVDRRFRDAYSTSLLYSTVTCNSFRSCKPVYKKSAVPLT